MRRRAGRPPAALDLIPHSEIAAKLGASESTVKRELNSALAKLKAAGQLEGFLAIAQHVQATRELKFTGGVHIPCGSIECRPDKWVFYAEG